MKQMFCLAIVSAGMIAGCASEPAGKAVSQTRAGLTEAALSPLEDLNLRHDAIPSILKGIDNPYDVPQSIGCDAIEAQVIALDKVLPPDWDASPETDKESFTDKAADTASDSMLDAVASEASGLIPYRGWVRRLSGANSHEKKLKAAFERGSHRRTYLKALGQMKACSAVAVPRDLPASDRTPVHYRGDAPASHSGETTSRRPPRQIASEPPRLAQSPRSGPLDLRTSEPSSTETDSVPAPPSREEFKREAKSAYLPSGR